MTKPIRIEHLTPCVDWWGGASRQGRTETEVAWKVTAEEVKERGYNLDIKNPHVVTEEHLDPAELLRRLNEAEAETTRVARRLKSILEEALLR
jgi:type I restriction enzyme M protein